MSVRPAPHLRIQLACGLLLGALAAPAGAVDGVLEINQTCAVQTGCFAGDPPGFPVGITQAGSYRLTSALGASGTAIDVDASGVSLDLNGFGITGDGSAGSRGVRASQVGLGPNHVTIRNGLISDFEVGIDLESFGRVEAMTLRSCAMGISAGDHTVVRGSTMAENSATGIAFLSGGAGGGISGNVFAENGSDVSGPFTDMGGNVCGGESCAGPPMRRYYLAPGSFQGDQALSACAAGFHMASLWEIHEPSLLRYDRLRGQLAADSGGGPPGAGCGTGCYGWVRTGGGAVQGPFVGDKNCNVWTSSSSGIEGAVVLLPDDWDNTLHGQISPWIGTSLPCDWTIGVWCVQD